MWVKSLLNDIGVHLPYAPVVWSDNTSDIALSENLIHHSKIKHLDIDLFFIREKVHSNEIIVYFVPAIEQGVDVLTKPLTEKSYMFLVVRNLEFSQLKKSRNLCLLHLLYFFHFRYVR